MMTPNTNTDINTAVSVESPVRIVDGSFVTMHYRVSVVPSSAAEAPIEIVSTYDLSPATFLIGDGQLAQPLVDCLIGLPEAQTNEAPQSFFLTAERAFGQVNPQLIETIARSAMPAVELKEQSIVEFTSPEGNQVTGFIRSLTPTQAVVDFNHPLAGKSLLFEVTVLSIL